jgi:chemotaxis protein CheZ
MAVQRKVFRIEKMNAAASSDLTATSSAPDPDAATRHHEILSEIKALRSLVEPHDRAALELIEAYKAQIAEVQKFKTELDLIQDAIARTKQEIATIHVTGFSGPQMARVTNELDAVVDGTENATQSILKAAEDIDQSAHALSICIKLPHEQGMVQDIQERVTSIFEACNFQDLTGQRITKVVSTLKFIEEHIFQMLEIWGGLEALRGFVPDKIAEAEGDAKLLNGPKLDEDPGHASQDDIDALFD